MAALQIAFSPTCSKVSAHKRPENTISRLDIDSASAAILFEGYALILVFKQIFVFLIYVGRLAEIFVLLARSCFDGIHLHGPL